MLIKEQTNSQQSSLLIGPSGILASSKLFSIMFTRKILVGWKLLNFARIFLLIWWIYSLVLAKKKPFFIIFILLNYILNFFAVSSVNLWFHGFDITRFHNSFLIFRYWIIFQDFFVFTYCIIEVQKKHNWT